MPFTYTSKHNVGIMLICISYGLEIIPPREGLSPKDHLFHLLLSPVSSFFNLRDFKSCCIMSLRIFLLQSERLQVLLYHVSPSLLLLSLTADPGDLCCHNSFHMAFIAVPSQSGLSCFCQ